MSVGIKPVATEGVGTKTKSGFWSPVFLTCLELGVPPRTHPSNIEASGYTSSVRVWECVSWTEH